MNAKQNSLKAVRCIALLSVLGMLAAGCATTRTANNDPEDWLAQACDDSSWKSACSEYSLIGF